MLELPGSIVEALYGVVYTQRAIAWLQVDERLSIAGSGGHLDHYGLGDVRRGEPVGEQVPFLDGFLPLPESPFFLRSMELVDGRAADVQCYADGDSTWILLLDVTAERDEARRLQQRAYDMTLLREKEALLNRRLEAANAALRQAQSELRKAYDTLEADLAEAAAYVRSILPAPMRAPFAADWRFVPSAKLGGDCFGYHWIDDEHFAMYLIDVCGHGVGPSLLSVGALDAIRSGTLPGADLRDPVRVLEVLNELYPMERHNDLFFTAWYGVYRPATGMVSFAAGGHPPAVMLVPGEDGRPRAELLHARGPLIGMMPSGTWQAGEARVAPGARVFMLSDGTFEVSRPDGPMMELDDLVAFLTADAAGDTEGGADLDRLLDWLHREHGSTQLEDDFSIVRFRF